MAVARVSAVTTVVGFFFAICIAAASPAVAQNGDSGDAGSWVTKQGRHIRLVTDLGDSDQLNRWVATFDDAVPLWASYWNRDADAVKDFHVTAYLMVDKSAFVAKGVLPRSLPDFRHGYQSGDSLWVNHQPSDYYNAHLLLHEGAHAIAAHFFGGGGPPWYSEGTAEWLSVHETAPTRVGAVPDSPESVLGWGRLELIAAARDANRIPSIESVMRYGDTAHRDVEPYAWSWLAVTLMEMYPEYREAFRGAALGGRDTSPEFTRKLYRSLQRRWPELSARWRLLAADIDYGWQPERHRVDLPTDLPRLIGGREQRIELDVTHGWQTAPFKLMPGQTVNITAPGRFVIRRSETGDPNDDWESEATGVTLRYHRGRPIGQLVATLVSTQPAGDQPFVGVPEVTTIGAAHSLTATAESYLLLRINESSSGLADNAGTLSVGIVSP